MKAFFYDYVKPSLKTIIICITICYISVRIIHSIRTPYSDEYLKQLEKKIELDKKYEQIEIKKDLVLQQKIDTLKPEVLRLDKDNDDIGFALYRLENSEAICYGDSDGVDCKWKDDNE